MKRAFLASGSSGMRGGDVVDPGLLDLQRQQVGVGEIAVVMRLFLGAHRPGFALVGIVEPGFLHDVAAVFQNGDLAAGLIVDGQSG